MDSEQPAALSPLEEEATERGEGKGEGRREKKWGLPIDPLPDS